MDWLNLTFWLLKKQPFFFKENVFRHSLIKPKEKQKFFLRENKKKRNMRFISSLPNFNENNVT